MGLTVLGSCLRANPLQCSLWLAMLGAWDVAVGCPWVQVIFYFLFSLPLVCPAGLRNTAQMAITVRGHTHTHTYTHTHAIPHTHIHAHTQTFSNFTFTFSHLADALIQRDLQERALQKVYLVDHKQRNTPKNIAGSQNMKHTLWKANKCQWVEPEEQVVKQITIKQHDPRKCQSVPGGKQAAIISFTASKSS